MSDSKAFVLEMVGIISTRYNRRNVAQMRSAFTLAGNNGANDYVLAPSTHVDLVGVANVVMLATDSPGITLTLTKGVNSFTMNLVQVAVLTDAFDNIRISNSIGSGDPARVRAVYG